MEKKLKAIKASTIIICITLFICVIILAFQFVKMANLRNKQNNLELYKSELTQQIQTYDATNNYYNNQDEYFESYAREVLGWGLSDEVWYTISK